MCEIPLILHFYHYICSKMYCFHRRKYSLLLIVGRNNIFYNSEIRWAFWENRISMLRRYLYKYMFRTGFIYQIQTVAYRQVESDSCCKQFPNFVSLLLAGFLLDMFYVIITISSYWQTFTLYIKLFPRFECINSIKLLKRQFYIFLSLIT